MICSFGTRKAPERVPTDTVIPLRFWDNSALLKALVVYATSRYDVVLDGEKLRDALERLLARDGWRKLGARLRKNNTGNIEYHIPAAFTPSRPAVTYSSATHVIPISEHPLASHIPKPSNSPAVVGDPELLSPLVGLHVVTFADATLVVLYYTHTAFDLMGWGALFEAWTHMVHGREDQVATPIGLETGVKGDEEKDEGWFDPLAEMGTAPMEAHVLADKHMSMSSIARYGLRNMLDFTVRGKESRMVCIPGAFVDKLRADALWELEAAGIGKPFLSDGDVLAAWWTRLIVGQLESPNSLRTIAVQYAASARKALADADAGPGPSPWSRPYISNAFTIRVTILPAHELLTQPVSAMAHRIRRSLIEQGTRAQIEAYYALQRAAPGRSMALFGDAGMYAPTLPNWGKADLFGHDWAPAAVKPEDRATKQFASFVWATQLPFTFPEGYLVVGKDKREKYWLYGFRVRGLWDKVERALAEMS